MILAGLIAGTIAGAILLLLAHLAPYVGAGEFVNDIGRMDVLGQRCTRREGQYVGILMHVLVSGGFGAVYAAFVSYHWIADFHFLHIMGWNIFLTLFVGGIVMPLEGHGLFGMKEDAWFPLDLFLTNIAWGFLFWWLIPSWLQMLVR